MNVTGRRFALGGACLLAASLLAAAVLVSFDVTGTVSGNGASFNASLSADGRFAVFESLAPNLTATPDGNGTSDLFVRDLASGTTVLASVNRFGTASGDGLSGNGVLSTDGRYVHS